MDNGDSLHSQRILVLDFGSQYTQNIARKVRECQVYCEIHPYDWPLAEIRKFNPKGIILSGGPASVLEKESPLVDRELFALKIPILGICYGRACGRAWVIAVAKISKSCAPKAGSSKSPLPDCGKATCTM